MPSRPNGLPKASTQSPTSTSSLLPSFAAVRFSAPSIRSTARSALGSAWTLVALYSRPSCRRTVISRPSRTTWALVRITPEASIISPEPKPPSPCRGARGMSLKNFRSSGMLPNGPSESSSPGVWPSNLAGMAVSLLIITTAG